MVSFCVYNKDMKTMRRGTVAVVVDAGNQPGLKGLCVTVEREYGINGCGEMNYWTRVNETGSRVVFRAIDLRVVA